MQKDAFDIKKFLLKGFEKLKGTFKSVVQKAKGFARDAIMKRLEGDKKLEALGRELGEQINTAGKVALQKQAAEEKEVDKLTWGEIKKNLDKKTLSEFEKRIKSHIVEGLIDGGEKATGTKAGPLKRFILGAAPAFVKGFIFGFIDNFVMLYAGDVIDRKILAALGGTMAVSMGLGNLVSDVVGEGTGGSVESQIEKMNIDVKPSMVAKVGGGILGIIVGCLAGMSALFVPKVFASEKEKKMAHRVAKSFVDRELKVQYL